MNLQNQSLSSVNIVIDDKSTFNAIGDDVVLTDCVIENSVPARALSVRATLKGGEFKTKVQLDGFFWCGALLERVKFRGRYRNNRFGHLPEHGPRGAIENCDFAPAILIDCEFYDCDVDSLAFPVWPHLTVLHPQQARTDLESQALSPSVRSFFDFLEYLGDDCHAIVRNVETLTLPHEFPYDELRSLVAQSPNLRC